MDSYVLLHPLLNFCVLLNTLTEVDSERIALPPNIGCPRHMVLFRGTMDITRRILSDRVCKTSSNSFERVASFPQTLVHIWRIVPLP
jgi:hypothetical protein